MLRRPAGGKTHGEKEKERVKGDAVASAILVEEFESMALEGQDLESQSVVASNEPSAAMVAW